MVMSRSSQPRSLVRSKMSKAEADYLPAAPDSERCGTCVMFRMLDRCTAVEGRISPRGVCKLYESALDEYNEATAKRGAEQVSPFVAGDP
jgi:hypothetical protein